MAETTPDVITLSGVVVVVLVNYLREHQAWGWMRMVQGGSYCRQVDQGASHQRLLQQRHGQCPRG